MLSLGDTHDSSAISVVISDTSRMRCELLATQLMRKQPHFQVAGHAVDIEQLLVLAQGNPQLTVVSGELRDGPLAGFDALRQLRFSNAKTQTVVLLEKCEQDLVVAAFRGGARGVFCRSGSVEVFVKCLERVYEGQIWAGNTELQFLLDALARLAPLRVPGFEGKLSQREEKIAALAAAGVHNREIGRRWSLSEKAVEEAVVRICGKIGVQSRVELAMALRQNAGASLTSAGSTPDRPSIGS